MKTKGDVIKMWCLVKRRDVLFQEQLIFDVRVYRFLSHLILQRTW